MPGPYRGTNQLYFELLISQNLGLVGTTANDILNNPSLLSLWTDSGVTGANGTGLNPYRLMASGNAVVSGWPSPGVSYDNPMAYMIVGWDAMYGTSWATVANLLTGPGLSPGGHFGMTSVAENYAGGGPEALPTVDLWGNQTGTPGFGITAVPYLTFYSVPEPSTLALAGLGGLSLLLLRRRR